MLFVIISGRFLNCRQAYVIIIAILNLFLDIMAYWLVYVVTWGCIIIQEEKKTLERELARAKASANRIANVVANEWKDENDKVMPVRQWLEERRIMQVCISSPEYHIWSSYGPASRPINTTFFHQLYSFVNDNSNTDIHK